MKHANTTRLTKANGPPLCALQPQTGVKPRVSAIVARCQQAQQCSTSSSDATSSSTTSRRSLLASVALASVAATAARLFEASAAAATAAAATAPPPPDAAAYQDVVNAEQRYRLRVPASWERRDKAGADALFEDPARRSTSAGVTVSPVRVASIEQFGALDAVGAKLLETEAKKDSTLQVQLLRSEARRGGGNNNGALVYEYEYRLATTRGTKVVLNAVTITGSRLYILNAAYACEKCAAEPCGVPCGEGDAVVEVLRAIAASFDAGAAAVS